MTKGIHGTNLLILVASLTAFGQSSIDKPTKAKRVFTNEDLGRIREKYGSEPESAPATNLVQDANVAKQSGQAATSSKTASPESKAYWVAKLKEADSAIEKAKAQELKFHGIVEKYEQKLRDAKGDFHTRTSQEQLADSTKNLSRAKNDVKQGEETKAKVLAEATEKGFKPADLTETTR